jgi:hypothetical protein
MKARWIGAGAGLVAGLVVAGGARPALTTGDVAHGAGDGPEAARALACPDGPRLLGDTERHTAEITLLRGAIAAMRAEEIALIGEPDPFPPDLHPGYQPDGARATLEAALAGTRYTIDAVDCEEYPCLARLSWTLPVSEWVDGVLKEHAMNALTDAGVSATQKSIAFWTEEAEGEEPVHAFEEWVRLVGPNAPDRDRDRRTDYRVDFLDELLDDD